MMTVAEQAEFMKLSLYEQEREMNIWRNKRLLENLGLTATFRTLGRNPKKNFAGGNRIFKARNTILHSTATRWNYLGLNGGAGKTTRYSCPSSKSPKHQGPRTLNLSNASKERLQRLSELEIICSDDVRHRTFFLQMRPNVLKVAVNGLANTNILRLPTNI